MFILDLTNPLTLILVIIATALVIFLGQKIKSSAITPKTITSLILKFFITIE